MTNLNLESMIRQDHEKEIQRARTLSLSILALCVVLFTAFFSTIQIQRYRTYNSGFDLLTVEQPLWNTLHGRFMRTTYYPVSGVVVNDFEDRETQSLFADHFQTSLLVLLPIYALFQRAETLLILQSLIVALGAIPLYQIALRRLGSPGLALFFSLVYLTIPAVQTLSASDLHAAAFVPPVVLTAFDAMERRKWGWFYIFILLAFGLREDLPVFIGWSFLIMAPKQDRKRMLILFGTGILWSLASFLWIIPAFGGGGGTYLTRFFPLGTEMTPAGMLHVLKNPQFWWIDIQNFLFYNVRLGIPLLFIYFLYPRSLLAVLPLLINNGISWWAFTQFPNQFHYSSPVIPWVLIGSIAGFQIFADWLRKVKPGYESERVTSVAVGTSILMAQILTGYTPISTNFSWPAITGREAAIQELLNNIPTNAVVSAEENLAVHLARRETIRVFPDIRDAEYVLVDAWFGDYPFYLDLDDTIDVFQELASSPDWANAGSRAGIFVLRRANGPPKDLEEAFRPIFAQPMYTIHAVLSSQSSSISLVGIDIFEEDSLKPVICTWWELPQQPGASYPAIALLSPKDSHPYTGVFSQDFLPEGYPLQGEVTLCSRYYIDNELSKDILQLTVGYSGGERSSITVRTSGDFPGSLEVSDSSLLIHFKPTPGSE